MRILASTLGTLKKKFSKNERLLRDLRHLIQAINDLEPDMMRKTQEELAKQTEIFRQRYAQGVSLDDMLVEAFATVREASRRVLKMRHFDVQLYGGIALHKGMIAEMKTGEGKTLVATLAVYLNAINGQGVHVVTVNDYLAKRDSSTMRKLFEFLGLSVGCVVHGLTHEQRREAYAADITYGTNNEFGFDYLRDNMKVRRELMCQRPFAYAIVDEVDSILIDEARTPLIISGPSEESSDIYHEVNDIIQQLTPEHYEKDEKHHNVSFTDAGCQRVEELAHAKGLMQGKQLFQVDNLMVFHHLNQALKANIVFQKDVDYIVLGGRVVLIDEHTGRMMDGRRYSDGLHQAIEAKENVTIEAENQTVASITFQNYFRLYPKLAGMTGTAYTEKEELEEIYKLSVLPIPTNAPIRRVDHDDEIFRTFDQKLHAIVAQIEACYKKRQPILVGTASVEKSEIFAQALRRRGLPFNMLNARNHEQEASIIADAGRLGAITVATNMAGRGTDIKLGGNIEGKLERALEDVGEEDEGARQRITEKIYTEWEKEAEEVRKVGGLYVLGTERHESRRIDNQLRGRSGRQGDPGESKFFISLQDDLMRIFGPNLQLIEMQLSRKERSDEKMLQRKAQGESSWWIVRTFGKIARLLRGKAGGHTPPTLAKEETPEKHVPFYDPIQHPWLTRAMEKAQKRVEAQHFETRKHLLKYADVLNEQCKTVYNERYHIMDSPLLKFDDLAIMTLQEMYAKISAQEDTDHTARAQAFEEACQRVFALHAPMLAWIQKENLSWDALYHRAQHLVLEKLHHIEETLGSDLLTRLGKTQFLSMLDHVWTAHLNAMDHLRSSIHLQAYGQKDPLNEYKKESFYLFQNAISLWHQNFLTELFHVNLEEKERLEAWVRRQEHHAYDEDEDESYYHALHDGPDEEGMAVQQWMNRMNAGDDMLQIYLEELMKDHSILANTNDHYDPEKEEAEGVQVIHQNQQEEDALYDHQEKEEAHDMQHDAASLLVLHSLLSSSSKEQAPQAPNDQGVKRAARTPSQGNAEATSPLPREVNEKKNTQAVVPPKIAGDMSSNAKAPQPQRGRSGRSSDQGAGTSQNISTGRSSAERARVSQKRALPKRGTQTATTSSETAREKKGSPATAKIIQKTDARYSPRDVRAAGKNPPTRVDKTEHAEKQQIRRKPQDKGAQETWVNFSHEKRGRGDTAGSDKNHRGGPDTEKNKTYGRTLRHHTESTQGQNISTNVKRTFGPKSAPASGTSQRSGTTEDALRHKERTTHTWRPSDKGKESAPKAMEKTSAPISRTFSGRLTSVQERKSPSKTEREGKDSRLTSAPRGMEKKTPWKKPLEIAKTGSRLKTPKAPLHKETAPKNPL